MKYRGLKAVIIVVACMILSCGGDPTGSGYDTDKIANYLLTFTGTWSEETHPLDFPSNPYFSSLIGAVHNENVILWEEGGFASAGIKEAAETGSVEKLTEEIGSNIVGGDAYVKLLGEGITVSPGMRTLRFTAHRDFHYLTLLSRINPSPDWFAGVSSLSLYEDSDWIIEKEVNLYPFDAGTDSGETYTAENLPSKPAEPIKKITGYAFSTEKSVLPVGTLKFKRL